MWKFCLCLCSMMLGLLAAPATLGGDPSRAPWVGKQLDGKICANRRNIPGDGPYNYRDRPAIDGTLNMVENAHFPESVEKLEGGSTGTIMGDMDFTLRTFPNHHRALNSSVKYSLKFKKWPEGEDGVPAECYLQRAIEFDPKDSVPMELYGYYLHRKGKDKEALKAYKMARKIRPADVMLAYNTGLIMAELKQWEDAMEIARPLYDAGLSIPGLKRKLMDAGQWQYTPEEIAQMKAYKAAREQAKANAEATPAVDSKSKVDDAKQPATKDQEDAAEPLAASASSSTEADKTGAPQ